MKAQVDDKGSISLTGLPFSAGEHVEVTIRSEDSIDRVHLRESLRGSVLKYDKPFDPVCDPDDWEAVSDPDRVLNPKSPRKK